MVDNRVADLGQSIHIGLAGPEIAAFYSVVKQAPDAVTVIGIVFSGIDTTLGGDTVCPPGTVLDAEGFDIIAQFSKGGRGRTAGQAGADDDDIVFSFIGRIDKF